jgi:hypothetical protein
LGVRIQESSDIVDGLMGMAMLQMDVHGTVSGSALIYGTVDPQQCGTVAQRENSNGARNPFHLERIVEHLLRG